VKLGERLIALGMITPAALEEALGAQMAYGGRLGTNLVELQHLDLESLTQALAQHHDRTAALEGHFARVDPAVQAELSAEAAARWHAVPLFRDPRAGLTVVAISDPLPDEAYDDVVHAVGPLLEVITPELRLLYHLERAYGVQRTNRFRRVEQSSAARDVRRTYVKTLSETEDVPEAPSQLARISVKRIAVAVTGEHDLSTDVSTLEGAIRAMRRATSREGVAEAMVGGLSRCFEQCFTAGMVLSIRRDVLFGWRGFVRHADRHLIEAVAMPLDEPSLLQRPVLDRRLYAGPPPGGGTALDHKLWLLLRTGPPVELAVVPIELRGKIIGAVYVHAESEISADVLGGLAELVQALAAALDRLLRADRR
jgi:hypothetical protein